jgi:serine/threonine-protein kinase RsbT
MTARASSPFGDSSYPIRTGADVVYASAEARRASLGLGFANLASAEIALAVSELATNIIKYAGEGQVRVRFVGDVRPAYLEIEAVDRGPGIDDVDLALRDGVSEGRDLAALAAHGHDPRRKGLGSGLGAVARLMDALEIESGPGNGTRVVARKLLRGVA